MQWDLTTITAGDYTVEFRIPKSAYLEWKKDLYYAQGGAFEQGIS